MADRMFNNKGDINLLTIKFTGENLFSHGVPIYELGETFIAFQRIIHKCYLLREDRLVRGARLSPIEREMCALQIQERRRESDGYILSSLLSNPVYGGIIQGLIVLAINGIGNYVIKKVFKNKQLTQEEILHHHIKREVATIAERVGNVGGVEEIQIVPENNLYAGYITINAETRDYIRTIPYREIHGNIIAIEGVVTRLHPRRWTIDIKVGPKRYVTVNLNEKQYDRIRKSNQLNNYIRIEGRPIYTDFISDNFTKFEAHKITITRIEAEI